MRRWVWIVAGAGSACAMTPERFFDRLDREVAEVVEMCEGPSAPDGDVEGVWSGDVVCSDFDSASARACLRAYRRLRPVDCLDPEELPGAHEVPDVCDLEVICGDGQVPSGEAKVSG